MPLQWPFSLDTSEQKAKPEEKFSVFKQEHVRVNGARVNKLIVVVFSPLFYGSNPVSIGATRREGFRATELSFCSNYKMVYKPYM